MYYLIVKNIIYDYEILNIEKKVYLGIYLPHHRLTLHWLSAEPAATLFL